MLMYVFIKGDLVSQQNPSHCMGSSESYLKHYVH